MHIRVRVAYVAIGVTYLTVILSILFGCYPMHKNWQIYPNPGSMFSSVEGLLILTCQSAANPPSRRLMST